MKIEYDSKHDLMNIEFLQDEPIVDSLEVNGVIIDYAKDVKLYRLKYLLLPRGHKKTPWGNWIFQ